MHECAITPIAVITLIGESRGGRLSVGLVSTRYRPWTCPIMQNLRIITPNLMMVRIEIIGDYFYIYSRLSKNTRRFMVTSWTDTVDVLLSGNIRTELIHR